MAESTVEPRRLRFEEACPESRIVQNQVGLFYRQAAYSCDGQWLAYSSETNNIELRKVDSQTGVPEAPAGNSKSCDAMVRSESNTIDDEASGKAPVPTNSPESYKEIEIAAPPRSWQWYPLSQECIFTACRGTPIQMWDVEGLGLRASFIGKNAMDEVASPTFIHLPLTGDRLMAAFSSGELLTFDLTRPGHEFVELYRAANKEKAVPRGPVCSVGSYGSNISAVGYYSGGLAVIDRRVAGPVASMPYALNHQRTTKPPATHVLRERGVHRGAVTTVGFAEEHVLYSASRGERDGGAVHVWDLRGGTSGSEENADTRRAPVTSFHRVVKCNQRVDVARYPAGGGSVLVSATQSGKEPFLFFDWKTSEVVAADTTTHTKAFGELETDNCTSSLAVMPEGLGGGICVSTGRRNTSLSDKADDALPSYSDDEDMARLWDDNRRAQSIQAPSSLVFYKSTECTVHR